MRTLMLTAAALAVMAAPAWAATPKHIADAVANPARPKTDTDRDVHRKPAEMMEFAEVKPGQKVGELMPGGGYFTRVFAKAVGAGGHVYAVNPPPRRPPPPPGAPAGAAPGGPPPGAPPGPPPGAGGPPRPPAGPPGGGLAALAADPAYGNITVLAMDLVQFKSPEPLDLYWTSRNYHDMAGPNSTLDRVAMSKAIYDSLKPGGIYIVLDHEAKPGGAVSPSGEFLHRLDPALVRKDAEAAGFQFVADSKVLQNPEDDMTRGVRDDQIRDNTRQFILKFRKPK